MKVFLSWSGATSKEVATIFSEWLPSVLQAVAPYFSPDIDKGARWASDIAEELNTSDVGLIFLTRDNLEAPWIMFEAGALSKSLNQSRVIPVLLNVEATDLRGPLVQFQATAFTKVEVRKLVRTLNSVLGERGLSQQLLETTFEKWWPELEARVEAALKQLSTTKTEIRSDRELLEEVVELGRGIVMAQTLNNETNYQRLNAEIQKFRAEFHSGIGRTFFTPVPAPIEEEEAASSVQSIVNEIDYKFSVMIENKELRPEIHDLIAQARDIIFRARNATPTLNNSRRLVDYLNKLNDYVSKYHTVQKLLTPKVSDISS